MLSEKMLSKLAIVISVFALAVSIWQAADNRSFNEFSIKPHLQVNPRLTFDSESGLYLENAGTGTAFIDSISLHVNGKSFDLIKNHSSEFFDFIGIEANCYKESWPRSGAAIQAGKEFALIQATKVSDPRCNFAIEGFLVKPQIEIDIDYHSPYGEPLNLSDTVSLTERELGKYLELIGQLAALSGSNNSKQ